MHAKRISTWIICQAIFSGLQAFLISKISWIGKLGIATVHQEYTLLRSGWKTFLVFFGLQLAIILLLWYTQKKSGPKATLRLSLILFILGVAGLWYTYNDFLHTYSHRLLKERFHLGFYLFWLGWIGTCVFFLSLAKVKKTVMAEQEMIINEPGKTV